MPVESHDTDGIRVLTLARPPANAISVGFLKEIEEAAHEAAADPSVRAVIIRGNERFFSAGLDLDEMAAGGAAEIADLGYQDGLFEVWNLPKPTIAELRGHAIAGGAMLALACDIRIAARGAQRIGINETAFGIAYPRGIFEIVRSALPHRYFAEAVLAADLYEVDEAEKRGFLHEVVDAEMLSTHCHHWAKKLGAHPAEAYAYNKRLIRRASLERCEQFPPEDLARGLAIWRSEEIKQVFADRAAAFRKR